MVNAIRGGASKRTAILRVLFVIALMMQSQRAFSFGENAEGFSSQWFETSNRVKEEQPHWITPLITVTPRLEQEFRYDQSWQTRANSVNVVNYGGGKGLELIPSDNTELIIGVPAYQVKDGPHGKAAGWADESFLFKYRMLSANEEHGNYIVTGFLGVSIPSGSGVFTLRHSVYTPTIAVGKGWGRRDAGLDMQSTLGWSVPDGDERAIGETLVWNTAFQAHLWERFWPEIEANYTQWKDGPDAGKHQLGITTGVVAGRFPLSQNVQLAIGAGCQHAITSFNTYERAGS